MSVIADRYRRHADAFEGRVAAVRSDQWSNQSPCEAWNARDVVSHIVSMHGYMLRPLGRDLHAAPPVLDDPLGGFKAARTEVEAVLDDPTLAGVESETPNGRMTIEQQVDEVVSDDMVLHGWDLARATGQDAAKERVHPASAWLANETGHVERESGEHDLHAFQAIRRMDEVLVSNFMVFDDLVGSEPYDLVIGDEAWELDYFLHENPRLKRFGFAWMTDFVGWLPMSEGGSEAALTADYNAEMIEQRARYRRIRDRSIFVGDPDDIVDHSFGPGLPDIREWTEQNFDFAGYVSGFDPPSEEERSAIRRSLGYADDDLLCIMTVGGSGVGEPLLRRLLEGVPVARRLMPNLKFLVVTGPRIDHRALPRPRGVRLRGYVPDLQRQLAACDLAIVQGGLTTCMELTACRRPFIYVPLQNHFEQSFHVRHRLDRYGAGRCMTYDEVSDPVQLADAILAELSRDVAYLPVETQGAARAAAMLAELL